MEDLATTQINAPDTSVEEWKEVTLTFLRKYWYELSTEAMSGYKQYLEGRKDMLFEVVQFLERN